MRRAVGEREGDGVLGHYRLARDDVLKARRFEDEIGLCGAPIEDHASGPDTRWTYVPRSGVYRIPHRRLPPQGVAGMFVQRRSLSPTHAALPSARSLATSMAMGQAARTAAAMPAK